MAPVAQAGGDPGGQPLQVHLAELGVGDVNVGHDPRRLGWAPPDPPGRGAVRTDSRRLRCRCWLGRRLVGLGLPGPERAGLGLLPALLERGLGLGRSLESGWRHVRPVVHDHGQVVVDLGRPAPPANPRAAFVRTRRRLLGDAALGGLGLVSGRGLGRCGLNRCGLDGLLVGGFGLAGRRLWRLAGRYLLTRRDRRALDRVNRVWEACGGVGGASRSPGRRGSRER